MWRGLPLNQMAFFYIRSALEEWLKRFLLDLRFTRTCKKPLLQSIVEKYFEFPKASSTSEMTGIGKLSPIVTSLSFLKSTIILHFLLPEASAPLGITKIREFHGLLLEAIIPSCNIYSVCLWTSLWTSQIRCDFVHGSIWVYRSECQLITG
jgi:hypothetical protein